LEYVIQEEKFRNLNNFFSGIDSGFLNLPEGEKEELIKK
jgi:hypothetical protein